MRYWLDGSGLIAALDAEWLPFAIANEAPELTPETVVGRPLTAFISDSATVQLWTALLGRVRAGVEVRLRIRCDAPRLRRLLELHAAMDGELVRIDSRTVEETPRPEVVLLATHRRSHGEPLVSCSWCKRVRLPAESWVEVEDAVEELDLFTRPALPPISHGICPRCYSDVMERIRLPPPA